MRGGTTERRSAVLHLVFASLLVAACGGGGGSSPSGGGTASGGGGPKRFAVAVAATGSGPVNSPPAGVDCGTTCSASFDAGTRLSLAATPSAGWHFVGWGGACSGAAACDLTVGADLSVSANFSQDPPPPPPPSNACADIAPPADVAMRQ